jgi:hypothetical protein
MSGSAFDANEQLPRMADIAFAVVDAGGTNVTARGCVVANTGAGTYTVTLPAACPDALCQVVVTDRGGNARTCQVTHTSDTVKTIVLRDVGGVAANTPFTCTVRKLVS